MAKKLPEEKFELIDVELRNRHYQLRPRKVKRYKGPGRPPKIFPRFSHSPEAKKLYKWFIKKLFDCLSTDIDFNRRLEILFLNNQRRIVLGYINTFIKRMPGLILQTDGTFRIPTLSEQEFSVGTPIFIRMDSQMPNRIDIEKANFPGLVFCLTRAEYNSIMSNIEEITRCNNLLNLDTLSQSI